jgi:hypothetical protein
MAAEATGKPKTDSDRKVTLKKAHVATNAHQKKHSAPNSARSVKTAQNTALHPAAPSAH